MIGRYQTPRAFRVALEDRLRQKAQAEGVDLMRLRRQVAFDRILARLFAESAPPWLLKGGYTFELRLGSGAARATRDLDLSIPSLALLRPPNTTDASSADVIRGALQVSVERDLQDGFTFRVGAAMAGVDAAPYGGARYPIEVRLDARVFTTFHLDVGIGDPIIAPPEWLVGQDVLSFASIPAVRAAALSREQQFAEKLHAYTLPRGERVNTRVKDLVDLVLLIELGLPDDNRVLEALQMTFARRKTHTLPETLDRPPASWCASYAALAAECRLDSIADIYAAFDLLSAAYRAITESTPTHNDSGE